MLTPDGGGYVVYIPDFDINTEGDTLTEAIGMARDAIGLAGVDREDDGRELPAPSEIGAVAKKTERDVITFVDVDFAEYRRKNDMRTVRRNVTLPAWLDFEAEKSGVNVSAVLQKALKHELSIPVKKMKNTDFESNQ